jgi:hypothetical protein
MVTTLLLRQALQGGVSWKPTSVHRITAEFADWKARPIYAVGSTVSLYYIVTAPLGSLLQTARPACFEWPLRGNS